MRIAIDLTALSDRLSGLERCAYELTLRMIRLAKEDSFVLIVKNTPPANVRRLGRFPNVRFVRIRCGNKLIANQIALPLATLKLKADAILYPVFPMPLLMPVLNKELSVYAVIADTVCFDVPETMRRAQRLFWRCGLRSEAKAAKGIITVSEYSAERIGKNLRVSPDRITVAYNAVDIGNGKDAAAPEEDLRVLKKYGIEKPYYLTLSTIEPRKDIPLLLEAYESLKEEGGELSDLVVAGRSGWMDRGERKIPGILFPGFIEEDDLRTVYANAEAFIFPSYYEGFGLPPLEALACGVRRVLVSDAPALREVLQDTAGYFKRRNPGSLKQALKDLSEGKLPEASEEAVRKNLSRFSWESSAEKVLRMIRENQC